MENIYVQFDGIVHVYQQIVEIPMGTYCAPLIADLCIVTRGSLCETSIIPNGLTS